LLVALPALGQDAEGVEEVVETVSEGVSADVVFILNPFIMILGGILVMWMAAGFAMLEAGLVRSKNVSMQLLKNTPLFSLAAIAYYLIGYNVMYTLGIWTIGSEEAGYLGAFGVGILEAVG